MFFFWKRWNCKRWKTTHTYRDFHEKLVDFEWHRTKPIENIIWNSQVEISRTRQSSPIYMHCNHRHKHHMVHIVQLLQSSLHLKECWEGATAEESDDAIERKKNVCIIPQPCHQMIRRWLKATKSVKAAAFSNHFFSLWCVYVVFHQVQFYMSKSWTKFVLNGEIAPKVNSMHRWWRAFQREKNSMPITHHINM